MKNPQTLFHEPVMVEEVLHYLITDPSGIYVDGTLGGGSHAEGILTRLNQDAVLIGIDRDAEAVQYSRKKLSRFGDRVRILHGSYGDIGRFLPELGFTRIQGLFLDLGVSSHQVDTAERGFSYLGEGPLDMRMDRELEQTAADVINRYPEEKLGGIFHHYGEERYARRIARRIAAARQKEPILTTTDLAGIVRKTVHPRWQIKTLARIWQALRIEVNREMEELKRCLEDVVPFVTRGSRIVVLCYQALEDRMVKHFFRGEPLSTVRFSTGHAVSPPVFKPLGGAIRPRESEIERNSRASSARLRAAEYTG